MGVEDKMHKHKFHTSTMFGKIIGEQCGCGLYKMREGSMTLKDEVRLLIKQIIIDSLVFHTDIDPKNHPIINNNAYEATEAIMERVRERVIKMKKYEIEETKIKHPIDASNPFLEPTSSGQPYPYKLKRAEAKISYEIYNQALDDLLSTLSGQGEGE